MNDIKNYYEVIAKCGHVGKKNYIPIKFPVFCENGKMAARIVRNYPRVKHNHKDAILSVKKIDLETYLQLNEINNNDPYLKCKSKYEQRQILNLETRFETDNHNKTIKYDKQKRLDKISYKLRKFKIIEKSYKECNYAYMY